MGDEPQKKEEKPQEQPKPEDKVIEETQEIINKTNVQNIAIPQGAKFICLFQAPNQPLSIQTGGFVDLDQMLGFARRSVDLQLVERMISAGIQKQMQEQPGQPGQPGQQG